MSKTANVVVFWVGNNGVFQCVGTAGEGVFGFSANDVSSGWSNYGFHYGK